MVVGLYSHCVHGTSSQCIGSGVVPPLDQSVWSRLQSWSWRIFIKQIRNSNLSKHKRMELFSNLWTKNNFATARRLTASIVNGRPTTVACRSHSASSLVHSTMTMGVTQRVALSVVVNQVLFYQSKPNFRDAAEQTGEIVTDRPMCRIGAI